MKRRKFLKTIGCISAMSQLPIATIANGSNSYSSESDNQLNEIQKIIIPVGATTPFSALHISDSHLTRTDERDNKRKKILAQHREKIFPDAEKHFNTSIDYACANNLLLLHTGDLIDFVTQANLDYVKAKLENVNCFLSAGNHEYSQYVGEAKEDDVYKAQSYDKVQASYPNDLKFASRIINGVNFVAIDNVYYNFTKKQQEQMKAEIEKGLPIVIICHVPLYTPQLYAITMHQNNGKCAYVTGAPLELTQTYEKDPNRPPHEQWRNRSVQQQADKETLDFIEWLKEQSLLKAIICGHLHMFYQGTFSPTAMQYIVGAGYAGKAYEIKFI